LARASSDVHEFHPFGRVAVTVRCADWEDGAAPGDRYTAEAVKLLNV